MEVWKPAGLTLIPRIEKEFEELNEGEDGWSMQNGEDVEGSVLPMNGIKVVTRVEQHVKN